MDIQIGGTGAAVSTALTVNNITEEAFHAADSPVQSADEADDEEDALLERLKCRDLKRRALRVNEASIEGSHSNNKSVPPFQQSKELELDSKQDPDKWDLCSRFPPLFASTTTALLTANEPIIPDSLAQGIKACNLDHDMENNCTALALSDNDDWAPPDWIYQLTQHTENILDTFLQEIQQLSLERATHDNKTHNSLHNTPKMGL